MPKAKPTYYIRFDTYWVNAPDRFCGPFDRREDAWAEVDRALRADTTIDGERSAAVVMAGQSPADIKHAIRVWGVLSLTEARDAGLRDPVLGDRVTNVIGLVLPLDDDEQHALVAELREQGEPVT